MTVLTIDEAAKFLRLSRRSLYRLKDIPRVRYVRKLVYVQEDLEVLHCETPDAGDTSLLAAFGS